MDRQRHARHGHPSAPGGRDGRDPDGLQPRPRRLGHRAAVRGIAAPLRIPPHHDPACFGCGDAPHGLRLALPEAAGVESYESAVTFAEAHQGGPGIVHGGVVGAALDEACGLLATWHRFPTVTARFAIRFRRPVPIKRELRVASEVTGSRGRRIEIAARLLDGGQVLAEADGVFLHVPLEHFLATPEGRAAGDAWRRRLAEDLPNG